MTFTDLLYSCPDAPTAERENPWNVPDWRNHEAYPDPIGTPTYHWRWEFIRRRSDYRADWTRFQDDQGIWTRVELQSTVGKYRMSSFIPPYWPNPFADYAMPECPGRDVIRSNEPPHIHSMFCERARLAGRQIIPLDPSASVRHQIKQARADLRSGKPFEGSGSLFASIDVAEPLQAQVERIKMAVQRILAPVELENSDPATFLDGIEFDQEPENTLPKTVASSAGSKRRARGHQYKSYLRLLDARATGATFREIKNGWGRGHINYRGEEDLRQAHQRAKSVQRRATRPFYD